MSKKIAKIFDGIENLKSGLGTAKDISTATEFSDITLTQNDMENAYRYDWNFPKAVDIPAKDMTKKWLIFAGKNKQIEFIKDEFKRLKVKQVVRKALVYKALYGASYIIIESVGKRLSSTLKADTPIKKFHVYHKFEFKKVDDEIHESRVYTMEQNEFKDSLLFKMNDAILNLLTSLSIPASLMHKADMDILSIKGLAAALQKCKKSKDCTGAEEKILKRVQAMYEQLSLFKLGMKDSEEQFESISKDLNNYDALQLTYMQVVAGSADIPLTRFFGTAPKGFNSTGQGDLINYHESLEAQQDELIEPFLEIIVDVLFESASIKQKGFSFEFAPIRNLTPTELMDLETKKASIISMFADEIDPEALAEAIGRLKVFEGIKV